jgi:thioredoxin-dependent peroxiredoxin
MATLKKGEKAPNFEGVNQDGNVISLDSFSGKKVILYFYPKDNTPGCTAEACNLNDNYQEWLDRGFEVVGVSPDSAKSHKKFADKYGLKFNLIDGEDKKILNDYGVWGEKSMYGKPYMGVLRTTYVINEEGIIEDVIEKVDTKNHTSQIFKSLGI